MPVVVVAVACAWPLIALAGRASSLPGPASPSTWDRLRAADVGRALLNTIVQATGSTLASLAVGIPLGLVLGRYRFPGRRVLSAVTMAPFVLPSVVVGAAFIELGGSWPTVAVIVAAHACFNAGFVARTVSAAVAEAGPELIDAARSLGAPRWGVASTMVGAIRGRITGVAVVVFALSATSFGVVLVVGGGSYRTLETEIWYQTARALDLRVAAAVALAQLVVVLPVAALRTRPIETAASEASGVRPHGRAWIPVVLIAAAALGLVAAPLFDLVRSSLRVGTGYGLDHYRNLGSIGAGTSAAVDVRAAATRSFGLAALATLIVVVVTLAGSIGASPSRSPVGSPLGPVPVGSICSVGSRGRSAALGLRRWAVVLPMGVSGATLGLGLLVGFGRPPLDLRGSVVLVVMAQVVVALPLAGRVVNDAVVSIPRELSDAAADLGAGALATWRTVIVPQIRRPVAIAAGLSFAIAAGEVAAVGFLARADSPTLPLVISRLLGRAGAAARGQAMAAGCLLAAMCLVVWFLVDLSRPAPKD